MSDDSQPVTKGDLKNYATKKDIEHILEVVAGFMKEQEVRQVQRFENLKTEIRAYNAVLVEDTEERFLSTSHDQVSLHGDRISENEGRIEKLETAVF